jgi:hypothetical protein
MQASQILQDCIVHTCTARGPDDKLPAAPAIDLCELLLCWRVRGLLAMRWRNVNGVGGKGWELYCVT